MNNGDFLTGKDMQLINERFLRDKERLERLEELHRESLALSGKLTEMLALTQKRVEILETDSREQSEALERIEKRPGAWLELVKSAATSAVVAAVVSYLTGF